MAVTPADTATGNAPCGGCTFPEGTDGWHWGYSYPPSSLSQRGGKPSSHKERDALSFSRGMRDWQLPVTTGSRAPEP